MSDIAAYIANSRKAIIQILTLVVTLGTAILTYNILPDKYASLITAIVGGAGSVLHYVTPNAKAPGTGTADEPFDITSLEDDSDLPEFSPEELVTTIHNNDTEPPANFVPEFGKHEALT